MVFQDEIFGTARVAAVYLKHVLKCDKKTYLIGSQGIAEELHNVGIESTPVGVSSKSIFWLLHFILHDVHVCVFYLLAQAGVEAAFQLMWVWLF